MAVTVILYFLGSTYKKKKKNFHLIIKMLEDPTFEKSYKTSQSNQSFHVKKRENKLVKFKQATQISNLILVFIKKSSVIKFIRCQFREIYI